MLAGARAISLYIWRLQSFVCRYLSENAIFFITRAARGIMCALWLSNWKQPKLIPTPGMYFPHHLPNKSPASFCTRIEERQKRSEYNAHVESVSDGIWCRQLRVYTYVMPWATFAAVSVKWKHHKSNCVSPWFDFYDRVANMRLCAKLFSECPATLNKLQFQIQFRAPSDVIMSVVGCLVIPKHVQKRSEYYANVANVPDGIGCR